MSKLAHQDKNLDALIFERISKTQAKEENQSSECCKMCTKSVQNATNEGNDVKIKIYSQTLLTTNRKCDIIKPD